jgi:putative (di)nucleoside polyphosphate hydrolase
MDTDETPVEAMYRELREETGLLPEHVEVLGATPGWLRYRLPQRAIRHDEKLVCIGQKQVWFLLRMVCGEENLRLDLTDTPEFDHWRWVDFWYPVEHVVTFKRGVYARALTHLAPLAALVAAIQAMPLGLLPPQPSRGSDRPHPRPRPRGRNGRRQGFGTGGSNGGASPGAGPE